jgi:dephospho-CoA kinase
MADITIDNDGSLQDFHREIEEQVVKPLLEGKEQV